MASSDVLKYDHWITLNLYYKIEIVKLFYKAYNGYLPEILSESIHEKRVCNYSWRGSDNLAISRFNTKYMRNLLEYRGTILWDLINDSEEVCGQSALKGLEERLIKKEYYKDFSFNAVLARFKKSNYLYF